jgi:hypothetical protein
MITKKTKIVSGVSLVFFISVSVALVSILQFLQTKGDELVAQTQELANYTARESSYRELESLIQKTEEERRQLETRVLTEEKTIDFLTEIETLAIKQNVDLTTNTLQVVPQEGLFDELVIMFTVDGQEDDVYKLVRLFESLPYHAYISSLSLQHTFDENDISMGKGSIELTVSLLK